MMSAQHADHRRFRPMHSASSRVAVERAGGRNNISRRGARHRKKLNYRGARGHNAPSAWASSSLLLRASPASLPLRAVSSRTSSSSCAPLVLAAGGGPAPCAPPATRLPATSDAGPRAPARQDGTRPTEALRAAAVSDS